MPGPTPKARSKFLALVAKGESVSSAAKRTGIARTTAGRIYAASDLPFSGAPQPQLPVPQPAWADDQYPPPPTHLVPRDGYNNRSFQNFAAPLNFDGWNLQRARSAISMHDQGLFLESSTLWVACRKFAPVMAALAQRTAPITSLPREVHAGTHGLSYWLGADIKRQLAPREGLMPSPYFPVGVWGAMAEDVAGMGFAVLQHVTAEPDPVTGITAVYTRIWPTWATNYYRYRRTFVAQTDAGPVDILNDGKFTLVADSDEPHFNGAIRAIAEEALDGKQTQRARASYIDRYGNPKWIGTMPPGVGVKTPEGQAYLAATQTIQGPNGSGVIANGATYKIEGLTGSQSTAFKDALDSNVAMVGLAILGTDGTMTSGSGGVYLSPTYEGVALTLVRKDLSAIARGVNTGHVRTYLEFNFAASIAADPEYVAPVLDIPLPNPEQDARIDSVTKRTAALTTQIVADQAAGVEVTQARVDQLAVAFKVDAPHLSDAAEVKADIADETEKAANDPATPLPPDDSAEKLAAKMTADGVERCRHNCVNRCRICGIERVEDYDIGEDGKAVWKVEWRAIPKPDGTGAGVAPAAPPGEAPEDTGDDAGAVPAEGET